MPRVVGIDRLTWHIFSECDFFDWFPVVENPVSQALAALDVLELNAGICMSEIRIEALVISPGEPGRLKVSTGRGNRQFVRDVIS